jgi:hypothetical protein
VCQGISGTPHRGAYDGSYMKKSYKVFIFLLWFVFIIFVINNIIQKNQVKSKYKIIQNVCDTDNNKVIILVHDFSMIKINYNNIENVDAKNLISIFT